MTPDMERRLTNFEKVYGLAVKTHVVWDDGNTDVKAEKRRRIAAGTAQADDRFIVVGWAAGREVPVTGSDRWRDWPSRDAVPPADNSA